MTLALRPAAERGHANFGWLDSHHTFSFANYYDPRHMGFRDLRVINDDTVSPDGGFDTHGHRDMEIISYVVRGALAHRDTTGGDGVLKRGDVQAMSAGTGVRHSEFNGSDTDPVHFYQIWLLPEAEDLEPGYEERTFDDAEKHNRLLLVAARSGNNGAMTIHQDASVYIGTIDAGTAVTHTLQPGRHAWVQVLRGAVTVNGDLLNTSDGAAVSDEGELVLRATQAAEVLVFDLA